MKYLEVQTHKGINDHKSDQHQELFNFLLSIVRKFNDDQTLVFRTVIIKVAQAIKKGQSSSLPQKIPHSIIFSTPLQHQPYFH